MKREDIGLEVVKSLISAGVESDIMSTAVRITDSFIESFNIVHETKTKTIINNSDVQTIYDLYPGKCLVRGASTGKGSKNKEQIRTVIRRIGVNNLRRTIEKYKEDCVKDRVYMKNFSTFLNNVPEYDFSKIQIKESLASKYNELIN